MHVDVVPNSYISVCTAHGALFQNGQMDKNGFVAVLCAILYDMITPRAVRVIWDVFSVLLFWLGLGWYLWEFINNCTQFGGWNRGG